MKKINFKWIENNLSDCFYVREQVFVIEQNISKEDEYDGIDDQCPQVVGYVDNKPVATGRIVFKGGKYNLGRICVLKEYRGFGYATLLVEEMINYLKKQGITEIHLSSQLYVKKLYENIGFKEYGNVYMDCNIEHISMVYSV